MEPTALPATSGKKFERTWAPRIWVGSDFFAWLRIMTKGGFQFSLPHAYIAACTSMFSVGHSVLKCAQNVLYRRRIARTSIDKPPVFIIGHWRTGTTLLHEYMILDEQHNFPNTYQCMEPNHFLLTEKHFKKWFWFLLPERRPMDNMAMGWDHPQEDEFALCLLGLPSPYLDIIFPNQAPLTPGALDLQGLKPSERRRWKEGFHRFIQTLTVNDSRRLVLKSPPHSCRIPTLLELYPDARFVHIVRNPYHVYPSTVKLWKTLAEKQGLQRPKNREVKERVLQTLPHLYQKIEEGKKLIPANRFHELRYEDLTRDPHGEMRKVYEHLDLGGFDALAPRLSDYLAKHANYERNKFEYDPEERREVTRRWGDVIRHYGYPVDEEISTPQASSESEDKFLPFPNGEALPEKTSEQHSQVA